MKMYTTLFKVLALLLMIVGGQEVIAKPVRMKRTSDQHLADLEARMGLKNVKGVAVTVPLGSGVIDIEKIGRKRRSQARLFDVLFNHSSEEDTGDPSELNYDDLLYNYRLKNLLRSNYGR